MKERMDDSEDSNSIDDEMAFDSKSENNKNVAKKMVIEESSNEEEEDQEMHGDDEPVKIVAVVNGMRSEDDSDERNKTPERNLGRKERIHH